MRKRRFAQVPTSDEDDDSPPPRPSGNSISDENRSQRKRKKLYIPDEDEEDNQMEEAKLSQRDKKKKKKKEDSESESASENEEQEELEAHPLGEVIRVTGKGRGRKNHYSSFEYDGLQYELEDPVLLVPEKQGNQKPYVAIIKDIAQTQKGQVMMTGQWFYRPEEAEKRGGGNWESSDNRELFYSFHRDDVPAESVMHKCVVHFIPLNKQIPHRKQHPGFIVQKVYDTEQRRLFKLTDKDYEDNKQHEIDLLVEKTLARIGDLPDIESVDVPVDNEEQIKSKRLLRKKNVSPLDVSRDDEGFSRSQSLKAETPGSTGGSASEYYAILSKFNVLTGETQREKWLEKLLQSVHHQNESNDKDQNESNDKALTGDASFDWTDAAVQAVAALEKAVHETFSTDFQKYNQKMRTLTFNLKSNAVLARRLLNKELEPAQILNMSPIELKEGLTAEEIASRQPEESGHMQMTDARCKRCDEKQVGVKDIIQAGHGNRYQLECVPCGNTWYASIDDAATLTIERPSSGPTATVEKSLVSPRGADVLKKTSEAVLDMNKNRAEENPDTSKAM